jgi:uncharacterized membrane protein SpoIIM required for sporulation
MIIDLNRFISRGKEQWRELEATLDRLEKEPLARMSLADAQRFHYLYQRVSADLAKLSGAAAERATRRYLESLVARAYGEIHEARRKPARFQPLRWFFFHFPRTFRRHARAFYLATAITLAGSLFGGLVVTLDPSARETLMPFPHLIKDPSQRVIEEESVTTDRLRGRKTQGAAWYMTHNTQVALYTVALGATWGIGTAILLFSTGVMLGAVIIDFILAGETTFVVAWLLPHGSTEIPAILLAGQAGLVLAGAFIGRRRRVRLRQRLHLVTRDLVTLIFGVAVLLVWSGIVEAFLSQYHSPVIPYALKTAFGSVQLVLLCLLLAWCGRKERTSARVASGAARAGARVARVVWRLFSGRGKATDEIRSAPRGRQP